MGYTPWPWDSSCNHIPRSSAGSCNCKCPSSTVCPVAPVGSADPVTLYGPAVLVGLADSCTPLGPGVKIDYKASLFAQVQYLQLFAPIGPLYPCVPAGLHSPNDPVVLASQGSCHAIQKDHNLTLSYQYQRVILICCMARKNKPLLDSGKLVWWWIARLDAHWHGSQEKSVMNHHTDLCRDFLESHAHLFNDLPFSR